MRKQWLNVDSWLLLSILPIRVKAVVNLAMLPLLTLIRRIFLLL